MVQDALKVRMFGGFTLEYKDREIILDRNIASKTMQLLQIILLHAEDGGISKAALIEALYGRKEVENKNGMPDYQRVITYLLMLESVPGIPR